MARELASVPTVSLWSLPHSPRADPCCNTLAGVYFANNLLIRLKGQFLKTETSLPAHTCTCPGGPQVEGTPARHYLVEGPERDTAYHDSGIQAEPSEEASTLQGHVCQSRLRNANGS